MIDPSSTHLSKWDGVWCHGRNLSLGHGILRTAVLPAAIFSGRTRRKCYPLGCLATAVDRGTNDNVRPRLAFKRTARKTDQL